MNEIKYYLCDLKKCEKCSYPFCRHTSDVNHAINKDATNFNKIKMLSKDGDTAFLLIEIAKECAETDEK